MTDFTWKINQLERNTADGGVVVAHYRVDAVETVGEDTYTAGAYGSQGFTPDASADGFIAFDSLTEATVVGWVQNTLGGAEKVAEIEAAIQAKIDEQKNPTVVAGLPWAAE